MSMKKIIIILLLGFSLFIPTIGFAQEKNQIVYFYSETCLNCAQEKVFLDELVQKYPQIEIIKYEYSQSETQKALEDFYQKYQVPQAMRGIVPITFIGNRFFFGFDNKETTGKEIEDYIISGAEDKNSQFSLGKNKLPIIGEVDLSKFSLPALAVILGFFDGFNVCSLGALVLILGIVLAFRSRTKTLILGIVFILTTAIIYGLLIFLWHSLFSFFSIYIRKMELVIGVLSIVAGIYFFREFLKFRKNNTACEFGGISQKLSYKLQKVFTTQKGILALIGAVFIFAIAITVVEFPCSAALPVLFAGVLTNTNLPLSSTLAYLGIFLFFYMLDEIIVFLVAFTTMRIWVASPKFITWLNLLAAVLLLLLGSYYIIGLV